MDVAGFEILVNFFNFSLANLLSLVSFYGILEQGKYSVKGVRDLDNKKVTLRRGDRHNKVTLSTG